MSPPSPVAYTALLEEGLAAYRAYDLPRARRAYESALALRPGSVAARINLGNVLVALGDLPGAIANFQKAVADEPTSAAALCGLGYALKNARRFDAAVVALKRATAIAPNLLNAHVNLASALLACGEPDLALVSAQRAMELSQAHAEVHSNYARALQLKGRPREAIAALKAAVTRLPDVFALRSELLCAMSTEPSIAPGEYLAAAREFGARVAQAARARPNAPPNPAREPGSPLRVGFVTGDLHRHPVGYFLETVLREIDRARIELHVFKTQPLEDDLTQRLKAQFSGWHNIHLRGDADAAALVRSLGIHVLVDLAGHTLNNRLALFAWRPAPVQLSWLGYFASTGVEEIDYVIGDPHVTPTGAQAHFTERLWLLPDTRLCLSVPSDTPAVAPLPARTGAQVTFGCFQRLDKITDDVMTAWQRILRALPQARLLLRTSEFEQASMRATFLERLRSANLDTSRIELLATLPREAYLQSMGEVDLFLDTFPFPGGTTTCEALLMGVPTVTLEGETMLARQGAGLLRNVGLDRWVARTADEYVEKAVAFARDVPALERLRAELRQTSLDSALFDAPRFARNLERALESMWERQNEPSAA